jgi:excisionase family DNA binding protein
MTQDDLKSVIREVIREELALLFPRVPPDNDRLLNVEEAAQRLGLSVSTVYKKSQACELPSVKMGSRTLFRPADLDAYTASRRRSPERVRDLLARA